MIISVNEALSRSVFSAVIHIEAILTEYVWLFVKSFALNSNLFIFIERGIGE